MGIDARIIGAQTGTSASANQAAVDSSGSLQVAIAGTTTSLVASFIIKPISGVLTEANGTVGTSSVQLLGSSTSRSFLAAINLSTNAAALRFGTIGAPAIGGAGSFPVAAGGTLSFAGPYVPQDSLSAITAGTQSIFTVVTGS